MMTKKIMHTNKGEAKRKFNLIDSNPTKIAVIIKKVKIMCISALVCIIEFKYISYIVVQNILTF